jgi:hypothetical protein
LLLHFSVFLLLLFNFFRFLICCLLSFKLLLT